MGILLLTARRIICISASSAHSWGMTSREVDVIHVWGKTFVLLHVNIKGKITKASSDKHCLMNCTIQQVQSRHLYSRCRCLQDHVQELWNHPQHWGHCRQSSNGGSQYLTVQIIILSILYDFRRFGRIIMSWFNGKSWMADRLTAKLYNKATINRSDGVWSLGSEKETPAAKHKACAGGQLP